MPYVSSARAGTGFTTATQRRPQRQSRVRTVRTPTHKEHLAEATRKAILAAAHFIPGGSAFAIAHAQKTLKGASQIVTAGTSTAVGAGASAAASAGLTAAGVTAGGALLGTVVPVVGTIAGALVGALLSGHFAREKGAKDENSALNGVIPAIYQDIQTVAQNYMSGQISASDAVNICEQIRQNYWQTVAPFETGPGQHAHACASNAVSLAGGSQKSGASNVTPYTPCDKTCTASCCVGCNWINQWITSAEAVFTAGMGTIQFGTIPSNGYGLQTFNNPPLTVTSPSTGASSSGILSALSTGSLNTVMSSTIAGLPLWSILAAGAAALILL